MDTLSRMTTRSRRSRSGQPGFQSTLFAKVCMPQKNYTPMSPPGQRTAVSPKRRTWSSWHRTWRGYSTRFTDVQHCLAEIRDFTQNGKKIACSYPSAYEPQYCTLRVRYEMTYSFLLLCRESLQSSAEEIRKNVIWLFICLTNCIQNYIFGILKNKKKY